MLMYAAAFIRLSSATCFDLSENWMLLRMQNHHGAQFYLYMETVMTEIKQQPDGAEFFLCS